MPFTNKKRRKKKKKFFKQKNGEKTIFVCFAPPSTSPPSLDHSGLNVRAASASYV